MRSELLQFVYYVLALVMCGACEELLPKLGGVGVPLLLTLSVAVSMRRPALVVVLIACAAGAMEDALADLPPMTSFCFFLIAALAAWRTRLGRVVLLVAYPLYEIWLKLLVPSAPGTLLLRILLALPMAALMAGVCIPLMDWLESKAALDVA